MKSLLVLVLVIAVALAGRREERLNAAAPPLFYDSELSSINNWLETNLAWASRSDSSGRSDCDCDVSGRSVSDNAHNGLETNLAWASRSDLSGRSDCDCDVSGRSVVDNAHNELETNLAVGSEWCFKKPFVVRRGSSRRRRNNIPFCDVNGQRIKLKFGDVGVRCYENTAKGKCEYHESIGGYFYTTKCTAECNTLMNECVKEGYTLRKRDDKCCKGSHEEVAGLRTCVKDASNTKIKNALNNMLNKRNEAKSSDSCTSLTNAFESCGTRYVKTDCVKASVSNSFCKKMCCEEKNKDIKRGADLLEERLALSLTGAEKACLNDLERSCVRKCRSDETCVRTCVNKSKSSCLSRKSKAAAARMESIRECLKDPAWKMSVLRCMNSVRRCSRSCKNKCESSCKNGKFLKPAKKPRR